MSAAIQQPVANAGFVLGFVFWFSYVLNFWNY